VASVKGLRFQRTLEVAPPEFLFVVSAMAQYGGAVIAVKLFDDISPATVAYIRVIAASLILIAFSARRSHPRWTRHDLAWAAAFGCATAVMNLLFYLAIDRLPMGKGVTIEFIGPIAVAALRTRTMRNTVALALATIGVLVLGGVELGNEPLGLVYILGASVMWAGYIVMGSRVALGDRGVSGLGIGLLFGAILITPFGVGDVSTAISAPHLLLGAAIVGLLSNAIGYGIDQSTLRRIPIRRFSLLLALLPVCAAIFGFFFLDQTPTALDLAGMVLVLIGVAVQEREQLERHHQEVETT
jgi:inner membrane transporter RhtA